MSHMSYVGVNINRPFGTYRATDAGSQRWKWLGRADPEWRPERRSQNAELRVSNGE